MSKETLDGFLGNLYISKKLPLEENDVPGYGMSEETKEDKKDKFKDMVKWRDEAGREYKMSRYEYGSMMRNTALNQLKNIGDLEVMNTTHPGTFDPIKLAEMKKNAIKAFEDSKKFTENEP